MFAKATFEVSFAQRVVATLVAGAIVLWSIGYYTTAQAANLLNVSDTLTDSDLSVAAGHTIAFTIPTGSAYTATGDFTITFPSSPGSGFTGVDGSVQGDFSVTVNGTPVAIDNFDSTGQVVTLSLDTSATAGQEIVVALDAGIITNPDTAGSGEISIATDDGDTGNTRVAIIDNVLVQAEVQTTFDFLIDGHATGTSINGTSTTGSSTPTLLNFGVLSAGEIKALGQTLSVSTNARNGFVVTVESDGDLESATGAIIDNFDDGSDVAVPGTTWNSPSNDINDETTWGHWGLTSDDSDLGTPFGANEFIAASTTPRTVFTHDGPSDGSTVDIGQADVLYQIEITALQEAADDYNTTLTYIATPTF